MFRFTAHEKWKHVAVKRPKKPESALKTHYNKSATDEEVKFNEGMWPEIKTKHKLAAIKALWKRIRTCIWAFTVAAGK